MCYEPDHAAHPVVHAPGAPPAPESIGERKDRAGNKGEDSGDTVVLQQLIEDEREHAIDDDARYQETHHVPASRLREAAGGTIGVRV